MTRFAFPDTHGDLLGAHISTKGGLHTVFERAAEIGASALALFAKNSNCADVHVERVDSPLVVVAIAKLVPRGKNVAGVETDADPSFVVDERNDPPEPSAFS